VFKNITKEDIEREYVDKVGINGRQAAKKLGITYKILKKKMVELGVSKKKRTSKYRQLNDKEWVKTQYFDQKRSVRNIAEEIGATVGAVHSAIRWAGMDLRTSSEGLELRFPDGRFGENSPRWKGGRRKGGEKGRYMMIHHPKHPRADSSGYVLEHRLVMELNLGRYLTKDEIVHHLDGNGHNNSLSNLQLTTRKKHFNDHFDAVKEIEYYKSLLTQHGISY